MRKAFFITSLILTILSFPIPAFAQQIILGDNQPYGVPAFRNPNASVGVLVASGLQILYIFAGLAVLFFFVWGAFEWITSGGDKEKIAAARRKIVNAVIGLVLLALSAFIVAILGSITGINPFNMGRIPQLGQPPQAAPGAAQVAPGTAPVAPGTAPVAPAAPRTAP